MLERYSRQAGILPPDRLRDMAITVAGVGAVGRQLVLQLASSGAHNLTFYDHDTIEEGNLGPQGWAQDQVGTLKVHSLHRSIQVQGYCTDTVNARPCRAPIVSYSPAPEVFFCCVDGIDARRRLFEAHANDSCLFFDSRVGGESVQILSCCDSESREYYSSTLFSPEEAFSGSCTTRMSINMANITAGLLVQQLSRHMRDIPPEKHVMFNLLSMELWHR